MDNSPDDEARAPAAPLRSALLRRTAGTIRSLDSVLRAIDYCERAGGPVLVYRFALAGREERFEVLAEPQMLSVADLYPAAAALEAELAARHGISFRHSEEEGRS